MAFCQYNISVFVKILFFLSLQMARFSQTSTKVSQMMEIAFDFSSTIEKRETAISNLLVLAKENAGIDEFSLCEFEMRKQLFFVRQVPNYWSMMGYLKKLVPC